jgi:hypothetical protein
VAIIDLGDLRDEPAEAPPVRRPPAAGRPLRCAAVLLLALVVLAGAAPLPRRTVVLVPTPQGAAVFLAADTVFVVDPATAGGDRRLTAYAHPTAGGDLRRRWQAQLTPTGDYLDLRVEHGLVLLVGSTTEDGVYRTTVFDARTGEQRWQRQGVVTWTVDGGLLVLTGAEYGAGAVTRVEPGSGRLLWAVPVPPPGTASYHLRGDRVDRFALLRPTGEVQIHDTAGGGLLRTVDTLPGERSAFQRIQVVDDLLLLVPPGGSQLVGYGLTGLDRRWTVQLPLVAFVVQCGDLLCAIQQTGGIQALDPATGAVRWADEEQEALIEARDGRLLVARPGQRFAVRDAASGQVRAELGQWELVPMLRRGDAVIGSRRGADGRFVVAELDLVAGQARIIDVLPDAVGRCQAAPPVLICRRTDNSTGLWRWRP